MTHRDLPPQIWLGDPIHGYEPAKFCPTCREELVIGPVIHEVKTTTLDPYGHDLISFCRCGARHDDIWHVPEPKPRSWEKRDAWVAQHLKDAPEALRCPNEDRAR